jgi:hypothetical protein
MDTKGHESDRSAEHRFGSGQHGFVASLALCFLALSLHAADPVRADFNGYSATCGVRVNEVNEELFVSWPMAERVTGWVKFSLDPERPLIRSMLALGPGDFSGQPWMGNMHPLVTMTVGSRQAPAGRPPEMSIWNTFFDSPAKRPNRTHVGEFKLTRARVTSEGRRATVAFGDIAIGPFNGELRFTFYADTRLIHMEAVVSTQEDGRAFIYDIGLTGDIEGAQAFAWMDTDGKMQGTSALPGTVDRSLAVRHRILIAECSTGSIAIFPPPHQFFFPVDITTNNKFVWFGRRHQFVDRFGFGIRQDPTGGGNYVPWFNAPPNTSQRLGCFLLLSHGPSGNAMMEALRFTRQDRFADVPGHVTFSSHYHMAIAMAALDAWKSRVQSPAVPQFVDVFKRMGVQAVHLGEFHGDGNPRDPGPLRLPQMEAMFSECRRLSDKELLLIPGEEANVHLGLNEPGKHPGHWMLMFPKPVYWTMVRGEGQPFEEKHEKFGAVYHTGSRADMFELIKREKGLAFTAHARIKASSWTPDLYRNEDFYLSDHWLGAAWKAMPADLSRERLGERCLDLLSDMANWGQKKYLPGEVDVFKIDRTHELYGHMNINYLRLAKLPDYDEGWQPVLDTLRAGAFFTTTGEVLIKQFLVNGKASGQTLRLKPGEKPEVRVDLEWTFPLKFAEVISGDGQKVFRHRVELASTVSFGKQELKLTPDLAGRKWVRVEVWDIAANGAYTQPVWIEP